MTTASRIDTHCAGAVEAEPRSIRFGVVDGFVGDLWPDVFSRRADAEACASRIEGQVVLVAIRRLVTAEGEHWPLLDRISIL